MRGKSQWTRRGVAALLALSLGTGTANVALAVDPPADDPAARGLRYGGLTPVAGGACAPLPYQFEIRPGLVGCTHGPDPAPAGIDVRQAPSFAQLAARAEAAAADEAMVTGGAEAGTVPCIGYGTSGKRLEAIYAHRATNASRYQDIAPLIQTWAGTADGIVDYSAGATGGSRHLRWLHDADCQPIVHEVALSNAATMDVESMVYELIAAGYDRYDRRYVVWVDVSNVYCGIAMNAVDERPGQENIMNGVPEAEIGLFARIDLPCWGFASPNTLVEAHEIMHTLGAVQPGAPHSSSTANVFYGHCTDEWDTMCYDDGTPKPLTYPCPASNDRWLDCNHDDYFSTSPPAGSYLATHWNTASNSFMVKVDPIAGFIDLGSSSFGADIAWLAASGITSGCSSSGELFCPLVSVTRGQMAAFLDRALDLPATANDYFTDDESSIFEAEINRLRAAGIATGCTATTFCPNATVTRGQMAAFLDRALDLPLTENDYFTDDESSIFEAEINRLRAANITSGCTATTFCPTGVVTREQMAAFLHRAFD